MFNYCKRLPIVIIGFGLFMSMSYGMKPEPVDKNGEWQEFDVNSYLENSSPKIKHFAFSYDGEFFCGIKRSKKSTTLYLWNINNVNPEKTFYFVEDYFFSPKGNFLAIEKRESDDFDDYKNYAKWEIYSLRSYALVASFGLGDRPFFFPDESFLSKPAEGSVIPLKLWQLNSQSIKKLQLPGDIMDIKFSNQISCKDCMAGVLYKGGNILIDGMTSIFHETGNLEIFDVKTGCIFKESIFSFKNVRDYKFIPNSNFLEIVFLNSTNGAWSETWDMTTRKKISLTKNVIFSPDRTVWAKISYKHKCLKVFENLIDGKEIITSKKIKRFSFSSKGTFLGVLLKDKRLFITNTKTWKGCGWFNVSNFEFLGCDNIIGLDFCNESGKSHILRYMPYKNLFNPKNYNLTDQQNNIKNFFGGEPPVKYSDINVLCKKEK